MPHFTFCRRVTVDTSLLLEFTGHSLDDERMNISQSAIAELAAIHLKATGCSLSNDEVRDMAHYLLRVFEVLFLPTPSSRDPLVGSSPVGFDTPAIIS